LEEKMKYRKLGASGIELSQITMGCWALGGGYTWGVQDEKDSIETVRAAVDLGLNLYDTAEFYSDGYSEQVLGKALDGVRDKVLVATKVWVDNMTADKLVAACEGSLNRLKTDVIDLYQIHWPSRQVPLEETLSAIEKLKADGKIRWAGVCNFGVQDLAEAATHVDVVSNQLAYSLLFRAIENEILPKCRETGVGVLTYSSLAQGLLTGKFHRLEDVDDERARIRLYTKERPGTVHEEQGCEKEANEALQKISAICADLGQSMANVALAWVLKQPGITSVLAGARHPAQIAANVEAVALELADDVVSELTIATETVKSKLGPNADPWRTASRIR
jgi:aryl-alcohol dehydrogenase-like predicted oxidoreductase